MRKRATLSALLFLLLSVKALGCGCGGLSNRTPEQIKTMRLDDFKKATAVFAGEVVWRDMFTIKFKLNRVWKGPETEQIAMLTGRTENADGKVTTTSCEYRFRQGQAYLVFAYGPPDKLTTHVCSRTALIRQAEGEIKALDEIATPKTFGVSRK